MGTVVSFKIFLDKASSEQGRGAIRSACERLHELDRMFSLWIPDSPMRQLRDGRLELADAPPEIAKVLNRCREARELSGGWFDPWAMPEGLDPTGLVKGWAIEEALGRLVDAGVQTAVVNGGGDIALLGDPPSGGLWEVGIRHPWRRDAFACVIRARSAVATSGSYERGRHIIDPRTGKFATATASATVTGPSLALSDALATGLAAGGEKVLPRNSGHRRLRGLLDRNGWQGSLHGGTRASCWPGSAES